MSFVFHIYIFNPVWNKKLIYAVRIKIVAILLGESREVAEKGMRESSKVLVMFLDLGTVYTVEFSL